MHRVSSLDPTITPLLNFTVRSFLIRRWRPLLAKHHPLDFRRVVDVGTLHRINGGAFDFPNVPFWKVDGWSIRIDRQLFSQVSTGQCCLEGSTQA